MPCYLIIDHYRSHGKLMDVLCCIPMWWKKDEDEINKEVDETNKGIEAKKEEPDKSGFMTSVYLRISQANKKYNSILTWFVVKYYSPFLQNYIVKAVVIAGFCIILGIGIWGCTKVKFDAHLVDYSEDGSVFLNYAAINDDFFETYAFAIVTKEINYPELQPQLLEMDRRIRGVTNVLAPTITNRFWLKVMINYFQTLHNGVCFTTDLNVQGLVIAIISAIDPTYFKNECVSNTSLPLLYSQDCLCSYNLVTVEEFRGNQFTVIPRDKFYYYLTLWVSL